MECVLRTLAAHYIGSMAIQSIGMPGVCNQIQRYVTAGRFELLLSSIRRWVFPLTQPPKPEALHRCNKPG
jgi:hypothetical protein